MEPTTTIIIITLSNFFLTPILQYLLQSKCTHIKTPCGECERTLSEPSTT